MMTRFSYRYWIALLLFAAIWQLGQGAYIHLKALLAQELLEQAWAKSTQGEQKARPWPWADTWPVARLSVPHLDENLIVLAGDSGRTLAFGPGHSFASTQPGESGNSFISGHRDTHFRFLKELQKGDRIFIETPQGKRSIYVVEHQTIVDSQQAYFNVDERRSRLKLITCYPFDAIVAGGTQRYIVSAVEIKSNEVQNQHYSL